MAYTLADFSAQATQPLKKAVIETWRKESFLMDKLSFETTGTLSVEFVRTKTLPTITARNIGEGMTESKGVLEPMSETVSVLSAYIDVPREYVAANNTLGNIRAEQTKMFSKALAFKFNDMFINGTPASNPKEMTGIWYRLVNDFAAAQSINGGAIDVSPDSATLSTDSGKLIDFLNELNYAVDGHQADMFLCNKTLYLRILAAIRLAGLWAETKDNFGRTMPTFNGIPIIDIGTAGDQSTSIITDTELATGAALTGGGATSIYAI
jgi:HK97 family phage major capsid protein